MFSIDSPTKILMTKKKDKYFQLNINQYRNLHWSGLNKSKVIYGDIMFQLMAKHDYHLLKYDQ